MSSHEFLAVTKTPPPPITTSTPLLVSPRRYRRQPTPSQTTTKPSTLRRPRRPPVLLPTTTILRYFFAAPLRGGGASCPGPERWLAAGRSLLFICHGTLLCMPLTCFILLCHCERLMTILVMSLIQEGFREFLVAFCFAPSRCVHDLIWGSVHPPGRTLQGMSCHEFPK